MRRALISRGALLAAVSCAATALWSCTDITAPPAPGMTRSASLNPAGAVVVSPAAMHGWWFMDDATGGACTDQTRCKLVAGPGTPPLGSGSAELAATSTADATLALDDYASTRFSRITALRYSTGRAAIPQTISPWGSSSTSTTT